LSVITEIGLPSRVSAQKAFLDEECLRFLEIYKTEGIVVVVVVHDFDPLADGATYCDLS
jgi:hypothetical protein